MLKIFKNLRGILPTPFLSVFFVLNLSSLICVPSIPAAAEVRVPFSDVSVKVGKTKRLATTRTATFLMSASGVAQLERDPLSGALLLRGLREGEAWLYAQSVAGTATQKIKIRVLGAVRARTRAKIKTAPVLRRDFQVPGWD